MMVRGSEMPSPGTAAFRKQITCPPAEMLLAHRTGKLAPPASMTIHAHLIDCEFCGAEAQLLKRCPSGVAAEECAATEIPPHLRLLFEQIGRLHLVAPKRKRS